MQKRSPSTRKSPTFGVFVFLLASVSLGGATYSVGLTARQIFLQQEEEIVPIIAGGELDDRGGRGISDQSLRWVA